MNPDRWRQITEIFHAALERDEKSRGTFLENACRHDPALRAEVERLITSHHEAGTMGETPIGEPAIHLAPGTAFGAYLVSGLLGTGGMGEVYRARDPKLRRDVAIKVLPAEVANDPDRLSRFTREARVLASLNHPNVGAIYEVEDTGGLRGLVLELIEGPTLADRVGGGALPVREALGIARQIAAALEAAHAKGIIHRDLKPANVKLTPGGVVKVIDFGIAKALIDDRAESGASLTATSTGMIVGTAAYMSPEQARGGPIDKRTDIWAFGCVVYEMLTGRQPFDAGTASDMIARILEHEPAWNRLPATVPPEIVRLLKRCLNKEPSERLHDVADARLEIADATSTPTSATEPVRAKQGLRDRWMWAALAAAVAVTLGTIWWAVLRPVPHAPSAPPVEFGVRFPDNYFPATGVAVAPDGRRIAVGVFGNTSQIWVHSLDSYETRPVAGTEGAQFPFWSPDGTRLGFSMAGKLALIDPAGGPPAVICELPRSLEVVFGGAWNTSDMIVFPAQQQLFKVRASGGSPTLIPVTGTVQPSFPQFLDDQRHFIFYNGRQGGGGSIEVTSIDGGNAKSLVKSDGPGVFVAPNHLLFVRGAALMDQRLNQERLTVEGDPKVAVPNVSSGVLFGFRASVSASPTGVLAFARSRGGSTGQLVWFDRTGQSVGAVPQPPDGEYLNPSLSPNGNLLAVNLMDSRTGDWDIWLIDVARGVVTSRLTSDPARDSDPVWSSDSKEIIFVSDRGGSVGLYRKAVDGSSAETLIWKMEGVRTLVPTDWSRDYVLYDLGTQEGRSIWALPLFGDRNPIQLVDARNAPYAAHLSPDGRWLAYASFETGPGEIYVQRFPVPGQKQQISNGGGVHPRWRADGRELIYWAVPDHGVDAVAFESLGSTFRVGPRRTLVQPRVLSLIDARTHYDITRDGKRVLVRQPAGPQQAGLSVILNWTEKLK